MNSAPSTNEHARTLLRRFTEPTSGVHAVLLYGAEGAPLEELARMLASSWLCLVPQDGKACGECRACKAFLRDSLVDFLLVAPVGASSIIRIDAITPRPEKPNDKDRTPAEQSLQWFMRTPPLLSTRKVVYIRQADRLNSAAANSLLKVLEEPHEYGKLILTTTSLSSVLPTIISRCVSVPIELSGGEDMPHIREEIHQLSLRLTKKNLREALKMAEAFRDICTKMEEKGGLGARGANSKGLTILAAELLAQHPRHPEWAQRTIEAHRRITGNANSATEFDALFASLMS